MSNLNSKNFSTNLSSSTGDNLPPIEKKELVNFPVELWRTIEEFPDYEVSNIARIRNKKTGLIRIPSVGKRGYPSLSFKKDGELYQRTLHRVFAIA